MKFLLMLMTACTHFTNCTKSNPPPDKRDNDNIIASVVKGKILNAQGQPVAVPKYLRVMIPGTIRM